ncbi:MAG: zinc ribbon domain-containing protein [Allobaculum sp.]|nr:zinc ribbon domain-containing protein [Allobaculum sp.]
MIKNTNTEKTPEVRIQELEKQVEDLATRINKLDIQNDYLIGVTKSLIEYQGQFTNALIYLKGIDIPDWRLCPICGGRIDKEDNCCAYCGRDPLTGQRLKSVEEYLQDSCGKNGTESNSDFLSNS